MSRNITLNINGVQHTVDVEDRMLLSDAIREKAGLTGTHVACEHGVCGACTILLDGEAVRSCLMFTVQAAGHEITTVEGIAPAPGELSVVQRAMQDNHGLQCGFCTPGIVTSLTAYLRDFPNASDDELKEALSGNLCRCTGYMGIVNAARQAQKEIQGSAK